MLPRGKTKRPLLFYLFVVWPLAIVNGVLVAAVTEAALRFLGSGLTPVAVLAFFVAYLTYQAVVKHYEEDDERTSDQ